LVWVAQLCTNQWQQSSRGEGTPSRALPPPRRHRQRCCLSRGGRRTRHRDGMVAPSPEGRPSSPSHLAPADLAPAAAATRGAAHQPRHHTAPGPRPRRRAVPPAPHPRPVHSSTRCLLTNQPPVPTGLVSTCEVAQQAGVANGWYSLPLRRKVAPMAENRFGPTANAQLPSPSRGRREPLAASG
jgi:hypothetical protein